MSNIICKTIESKECQIIRKKNKIDNTVEWIQCGGGCLAVYFIDRGEIFFLIDKSHPIYEIIEKDYEDSGDWGEEWFSN